MTYYKRMIECAVCKGNAQQTRALCSICNAIVTKEYDRLKMESYEYRLKARAVYQKWLKKGLR